VARGDVAAVNEEQLTVFSGLNGAGVNLAHLDLPTTVSNCPPQFSAGFCPFIPIGVAFAGTAMSISFNGVANQIVFDDVTFGSVAPPTPAPEPASIIILGSGLAGLAMLRRRKAAMS
jgi:hypothetical protein